jgi:hypothetical protein
MFGSVRSVTSSAVRALKYTTRQQGVRFSVRKWVKEGAALHSGGRGGVLFIPYKADQIATLRSTISAWMRIAIFGAPAKLGASSGCNSHAGKGGATPPEIEPWAHGGNDMS